MKIAVINVTSKGESIVYALKKEIEFNLYSKNQNKDFNIFEITGEVFNEYNALIFISSTGIAVRAIAPFIKSKITDPAVIVIDSTGKYVISLLSGHLGGANDLTEKIARVIGGEAVITTATDNLGLVAPDVIAMENKLIIQDMKKAKNIAALLVNNEKVAFLDDDNIITLPKGYCENPSGAKAIVHVTGSSIENSYNIEELKLFRQNIILGIGCRKDFSSADMRGNIIRVLAENNIDLRAIHSIATVDVKKDEKAIIDLSKELNCQLNIFTREDIKAIQHKFEGSDFVEKTIGIRAVSEPCVELSGAKIIVDKIKLQGMTLCIGKINLSKDEI